MASINDNLFTTLTGSSQPVDLTGWLRTSFGAIRVGFTPRGLAELVFDDSNSAKMVDEPLFQDTLLAWVRAFEHSDKATQWDCLDLRGTDFQQSVWRALLEIPLGEQRSYASIAAAVGRPNAARAVGSAVGANPIALLVPCHRVRPRKGGSGNYRWGADRKRALLDVEQESGSDLSTLFQ